MKVKLSELREKVVAGVAKLGYKDEDAKTIADVLLYAQLRGNNQGITKIATGGVPKASDVEELRVTKENKCGALLSGGHSMVATAKAAQMAFELAQKHGVGIVGINHTNASSGAIGYYARKIAERGYIGFVCTGSTLSLVAPSGSAEAKLGTNPFAYAFPHSRGVVVFDSATSAMARFGVVEAQLKGEQVSVGTGYDSTGVPTTDPAKILDGGSIATFADYKGYGLSLFVQMLSSAFVLAGITGTHEEDGWGTFVLAIDPTLLAGEEFTERSTELVDRVKSAKPLPGKQVTLPGERGDAIAKQADDSGEIEIANAIWDELKTFVG